MIVLEHHCVYVKAFFVSYSSAWKENVMHAIVAVTITKEVQQTIFIKRCIKTLLTDAGELREVLRTFPLFSKLSRISCEIGMKV